jgi:hypothetical protein
VDRAAQARLDKRQQGKQGGQVAATATVAEIVCHHDGARGRDGNVAREWRSFEAASRKERVSLASEDWIADKRM